MSPGFAQDTVDVLRSAGDYVSGLFKPQLRLGITGLSRSGKTVFLTALVHALIQGGSLPVFRAMGEGRIRRAWLDHQPDQTVPRFAYEDHLEALTGPVRRWPESTRRISELRVVIEYESRDSWFGGERTLTLDIVDYPGEWLLDLGLLGKDYASWSRETVAASRSAARLPHAAAFHAALRAANGAAAFDETAARGMALVFTQFLRDCRAEGSGRMALPPGRFLMPGDLEGSPALTFAPLDLEAGDTAAGSLAAVMARRYEAYKNEVVTPFFRNHFARLDRQVVLVDALAALNGGLPAVNDLAGALGGILQAFRLGRNSMWSDIAAPRIDKVLFAAAKADHLHHTSHDRLEALMRALLSRAMTRSRASGAVMDVVALAAVRATGEASVREAGQDIACITGVPEAGESIGGTVFDGETEAAVFPGDVPISAQAILSGEAALKPGGFRAVKFRPPKPQHFQDGRLKPLPDIRLGRALEFLMGDRLR